MIKKVFVLVNNLIVYFANFFIWRTKKIWLFGSWMGNQFSDNTRYLFMYLNEKKSEYNIKKVVWFTRNKSVYRRLRNHGYNAVYSRSLVSIYYHLKSGVHIISNAAHNHGNRTSDLLCNLSFNAIKIQLWHGVGIKAVGGLSNNQVPQRNFESRFLKYLLTKQILGSPGGWHSCFWLATSKENARVVSLDQRVISEKIIITGYPRMVPNKKKLSDEITIIEKIQKIKSKFKLAVLYFPTFRKDGGINNEIIHPLLINGVSQYLRDMNILWIEKKHSIYSSNQENYEIVDNILNLNSALDSSLLLELMVPNRDILLTDYSSISSDAIYKGLKTLYYVPDYDQYLNEDRGFVADFEDYSPGYTIKMQSQFIDYMEKTIDSENYIKKYGSKYRNTQKLLFDDNIYITNMDEIMKSILKKIGRNV